MSEHNNQVQTVSELVAELRRQQSQLEQLTRQVSEQQLTIDRFRGTGKGPGSPKTSSRRKILGQLAAALISGAVAGIAFSGQEAQAKLAVNPPSGTPAHIGAVITMSGYNYVGGTPLNNAYYGLVASNSLANIDTIVLNEAKPSGVVGLASGSDAGVSGYSSGGYGVYGNSTGTSGTGVYGNSDDGYGVRATNTSTNKAALQASSTNYIGVYATSSASNGAGVYGGCNGGKGVWGYSHTGYAIYGYTDSLSGQGGKAGFFDGDVQIINGSLSKAGGSFKIDHPLDPANKYLYHSFVESPDMKNIYDGVVTLDADGQALVDLPDWFEALNRDFRYQLTALGQAAPNLYVAREVTNGQFKIAGGAAGQKVSWMLTGIRQDVWANSHRIPVEEVKLASEKGLYLHPALYNQPPEKQIGPRPATPSDT